MAQAVDPGRYDAFARSLHWLILALVALQFTLAWTMPDIPRGQPPEELVDLHLSFGIVILAVMVVRLSWRLIRPVPPLPASLPTWQAVASRTVHWALYLGLLAMPFSGWAWASAKGWPVRVFGLGPLPPLLPNGSGLRSAAAFIHSNLSTAVLILVGVHAAAALYHHLVLRDEVLFRMFYGSVGTRRSHGESH